jgi:hypothetical protein
MFSRAIPVFAVLALAMSAAAASEAEFGKNGGQQTHAGDFHVEVVPAGTTLTVYLTDHDEKPTSTKGSRGTAVLVVNGKPQRITLAPQGENQLVGTSAVPLKAPVRGAIQIVVDGKTTLNAKF